VVPPPAVTRSASRTQSSVRRDSIGRPALAGLLEGPRRLVGQVQHQLHPVGLLRRAAGPGSEAGTVRRSRLSTSTAATPTATATGCIRPQVHSSSLIGTEVIPTESAVLRSGAKRQDAAETYLWDTSFEEANFSDEEPVTMIATIGTDVGAPLTLDAQTLRARYNQHCASAGNQARALATFGLGSPAKMNMAASLRPRPSWPTSSSTTCSITAPRSCQRTGRSWRCWSPSSA